MMICVFSYPDKPRRGDAIAVLSPSAPLPARLPLPYELGLRRLREEFGLRPVEYPCTRALRASPAERAADIHAAFADPQIKAVIASIGGDDQLKVLGHLDPSLLASHPKPFFGYSDNTNLHLFLWNLGLVSYLGGSVMVQFGWPVAMHAVGRRSLEAAMFGRETLRLDPPASCCDENGRGCLRLLGAGACRARRRLVRHEWFLVLELPSVPMARESYKAPPRPERLISNLCASPYPVLRGS